MANDTEARQKAAVAIAGDTPLGQLHRASEIANKAIDAYLSALSQPEAAGGGIGREEISTIVSQTMRDHKVEYFGEIRPIGEGGAPVINWYALRNELVEALCAALSTPQDTFPTTREVTDEEVEAGCIAHTANAGGWVTIHRTVKASQRQRMRRALEAVEALRASTPQDTPRVPEDGGEVTDRKFGLGDRVTKIKGSSWTGHVVGFYSTTLTPLGYAVESETETGSVQIYPEPALKHGGGHE